MLYIQVALSDNLYPPACFEAMHLMAFDTKTSRLYINPYFCMYGLVAEDKPSEFSYMCTKIARKEHYDDSVTIVAADITRSVCYCRSL